MPPPSSTSSLLHLLLLLLIFSHTNAFLPFSLREKNRHNVRRQAPVEMMVVMRVREATDASSSGSSSRFKNRGDRAFREYPSSTTTTSSQTRAAKQKEAPAQLRILITGFGPFQGVPRNPSETMARSLGDVTLNPPPTQETHTHTHILSTHILETSAAGALEGLELLHAQVAEEGLREEENLLLVHLGVRNDIENFRLESVSYNEAKFSVPDERDFQPQGTAVSHTQTDTSQMLFSTLPLHAITREMHTDQGYGREQVAISSDPGRFVCNYLYFHSLELCRDRGHAHTACVFVHLPPFCVVCEEKQVLFLRQLLQVIGKHFPSA